jgi:hypothetical protein
MSNETCQRGARQVVAEASASTVGAEVSPAAVVERVHAGTLDPGALSAEVRRACVGHLGEQGFTSGEIAEVMKITERTVRRDRAALRREHGMGPDRELGDELLGEFERVVSTANARLTRLARDPEVSAYARLWAEEAQVRNYKRLIEMAHRLRYVESGQSRLAAQRREEGGNRPGLDELLAALGGKRG